MRRVLRATKYALNKDLRCRAYSVLLDVDSDVVAQLADSTWSVKTMNDGIIEDYIHHVFPRFAENRCSFSSASSFRAQRVIHYRAGVVGGAWRHREHECSVQPL